MTRQIDRRSLLFGRPARGAEPVRPPGALPEGDFRAACDGCAACVTACPTGVVRLDGERFPVMAFAQAGCTFCGACTESCPTGALAAAGARPWTARASLGAGCLALGGGAWRSWPAGPSLGAGCFALGGVACRSCGDACDEAAIRFVPRPDGRFLPVVLDAACTGCGSCVSVCPAGAVAVRPASVATALGRAS